VNIIEIIADCSTRIRRPGCESTIREVNVKTLLLFRTDAGAAYLLLSAPHRRLPIKIKI
jgi:hypothetical protein